MKVKSESEVAQSCLTLSDPMDRSPPGSSIHGIWIGVDVLAIGGEGLLERLAGALLVLESQASLPEQVPGGGELRIDLDGLFQLFRCFGVLGVLLLKSFLGFF